MKKIHFTTSKGEYLLVDDSSEFPKDFPHDFYQKVSYVDQLTEEQAKEVVESHEIPFAEGEYCYPDYTVYGKTGFKAFDTALESLDSLFESIGVLWENPFTHPKDAKFKPQSFGWYKDALKNFEEAEQNVFDKSRTYLFRKI